MKQGRIVVITGVPGTGKTTTASIIAKGSDMEKSVQRTVALKGQNQSRLHILPARRRVTGLEQSHREPGGA